MRYQPQIQSEAQIVRRLKMLAPQSVDICIRGTSNKNSHGGVLSNVKSPVSSRQVKLTRLHFIYDSQAGVLLLLATTSNYRLKAK